MKPCDTHTDRSFFFFSSYNFISWHVIKRHVVKQRAYSEQQTAQARSYRNHWITRWLKGVIRTVCFAEFNKQEIKSPREQQRLKGIYLLACICYGGGGKSMNCSILETLPSSSLADALELIGGRRHPGSAASRYVLSSCATQETPPDFRLEPVEAADASRDLPPPGPAWQARLQHQLRVEGEK
jgi:hypothetical protein